MTFMRAALTHTDAPRPAPDPLLPPSPTGVDGPERPSGRTALPSGITPSTIMSPTRRPAGSWTEIRPGARAHHTPTSNRAHAPPANTNVNHVNPDAALAKASLHR
jgi:hypothetical protein